MRYVSFFVLLVFCCSVGCLSFDEVLREKGEILTELQEEIEMAERQCSRLELAIAEETSPQRLAERAVDMGMVPAEEKDRELSFAVDHGDHVTDAVESGDSAEEEKDVFEILAALWNFRKF